MPDGGKKQFVLSLYKEKKKNHIMIPISCLILILNIEAGDE